MIIHLWLALSWKCIFGPDKLLTAGTHIHDSRYSDWKRIWFTPILNFPDLRDCDFYDEFQNSEFQYFDIRTDLSVLSVFTDPFWWLVTFLRITTCHLRLRPSACQTWTWKSFELDFLASRLRNDKISTFKKLRPIYTLGYELWSSKVCEGDLITCRVCMRNELWSTCEA